MRAVRHPAFEDRLVMSRNRPGRRARAPPRPCRSRRSPPCGTGCPWHSSRRARYSPALRGRGDRADGSYHRRRPPPGARLGVSRVSIPPRYALLARRASHEQPVSQTCRRMSPIVVRGTDGLPNHTRRRNCPSYGVPLAGATAAVSQTRCYVPICGIGGIHYGSYRRG